MKTRHKSKSRKPIVKPRRPISKCEKGSVTRDPDLAEAAAEELGEFGPRKGRKGRAPARPAKATKSPGQPCLCGCGGQAKGRFLAGHDAKLHSAVLRAAKDGAQVVVSEGAAGWLMGKAWARGAYKAKA